ncbi:MAG: 23S rRNA (guanosine(2251)-2'-O)-methyltransferase RlmB [Proteobacteria bacterium]|nr:23S rRNA (guanosine(2251)-2'-O)-methyltransferase RlmB [Pseudomonadota bacterium]
MEVLLAHPEKVHHICYGRNQKGAVKDILVKTQERRIKLSEYDKEGLDDLAGKVNHQGVVALLSQFNYSSLEELLSSWRKSGEKGLFVVLDGIQDPHNLGAIIRSAETAGIHGIIIPKDRAVGVTPAVEKVSAGAVEHVKIARVTNVVRTLKTLKKEGLWIAGAEGGGRESIYDADLNIDIALVIGSEGDGIRPLVKKECDLLLTIPMKGKINSLNASVAAALLMYEVLRQRKFNAKSN